MLAHSLQMPASSRGHGETMTPSHRLSRVGSMMRAYADEYRKAMAAAAEAERLAHALDSAVASAKAESCGSRRSAKA